MMDGKERMSFFEFCEKLKSDGAYIGVDGHVYRGDGKRLSRQCRNGYYMVRRMYNGICYYFMEHRVVWYMIYGLFDEEKVVNHINFDRADNRIENLELITQKENVEHARTNGHVPEREGCDHWRASLTEKEVQAIRYLAKHGWKQNVLAELFNANNKNLISRVVTGARYGNVPDAESVIAIYPTIVMKTSNRENAGHRDRLGNIGLGITGEAGEVADILKKYLHQGHELDVNDLILEIGDVFYYLCWLCLETGIDFSEICFQNMAKLQERYPEGFDEFRSRNRRAGDV